MDGHGQGSTNAIGERRLATAWAANDENPAWHPLSAHRRQASALSHIAVGQHRCGRSRPLRQRTRYGGALQSVWVMHLTSARRVSRISAHKRARARERLELRACDTFRAHLIRRGQA
jgi:hypothetical protein